MNVPVLGAVPMGVAVRVVMPMIILAVTMVMAVGLRGRLAQDRNDFLAHVRHSTAWSYYRVKHTGHGGRI